LARTTDHEKLSFILIFHIAHIVTPWQPSQQPSTVAVNFTQPRTTYSS